VRYLTYSRDGRLLASSSDDGIVRVWAAATGHCLQTLHLSGGPVLFSPDGRLLLAGTGSAAVAKGDDALRLWDIRSGHMVRRIRSPHGAIDPLDWSADGRLLAAGVDDTLQLWRADSWKEIRSIQAPRSAQEAHRQLFVRAARFSPDGRSLALVSASFSRDDPPVPICRVTLWVTATGRRLRTLVDDGFVIGAAVDFSPDGRAVAVGTVGYALDGDVRLWRLFPLREQVLEQQAQGGSGVAFVNDGRRLAAGGGPRSVVLYDVKSGRRTAQLIHPDPVLTLTGAPGGRAIATGDQTGTIRIWLLPSTSAPSHTHATADARVWKRR
jgi:WD40 repeat protein